MGRSDSDLTKWLAITDWSLRVFFDNPQSFGIEGIVEAEARRAIKHLTVSL